MTGTEVRDAPALERIVSHRAGGVQKPSGFPRFSKVKVRPCLPRASSRSARRNGFLTGRLAGQGSAVAIRHCVRCLRCE
ncbi:hypothetical protein FTUN_6756 [Frigoriglobus tundricola]|uniref:Uncharacterized protein n=1 Tax=Frigoriglobus tundricola TaxID=2774151 RepID=A0A6M5Z0A4_9BACT|nr:hypothetical protein FTUN_6756 [Frigoriglobus tundricola]